MRVRAGAATLLVGLCLEGCASPPSKKRPDLAAILEAYRKHGQQQAREAEERRHHGVRAWTIEGSAPGGFTVSVDLVGASRAAAIERILEETGVPYVLNGPPPSGTVTARFQAVPLETALSLLLEGQGLGARTDGAILRIEPGPPAQPAAQGAPPPSPGPGVLPAVRELPLSHLDTASALTILDGLYPSSPVSGLRSVQFGAQPYTNSILLSGSADNVATAATALRLADRHPQHVVIEALVVEFDANALEQLGLDLAGGAKGRFGVIATGFGSLLSRAVTFSFADSANNAAAFTALVDALVAQDKARLISRPYLATLSGKPASIQITRDRFVIVESVQSGAAVTATNAVPSGVTLSITPTIAESGVIRMDINVQDSQFIPTVQNVAVEVDRNQASTTMLVETGQSICIGGLVLNRDSSNDSGFPVLRHIPGLNLLFGKRKRESQQQEVVIYITPHIWVPGIDSPLLMDEQLRIKEEEPAPAGARPPAP